MSLPHITNSKAGVNKFDPVHNNIFEVYFTVPAPLQADFGAKEALVTEHVLTIGGLNNLAKAPGVSQQQFMGTSRSYINPRIDATHAEISVTLSLNLDEAKDNYIYNLFKAWSKLGYNIATGSRHLKKDYCADFLKVSIANREGDIYHEVVFKDVMMDGGPEGIDELNYESTEAQTLTVKFISDWWKETAVGLKEEY
jgi:hypothetical protein